MNKSLGLITIILFYMVLINPVDAANPVTYSCCKNFTTSNGTIFENFDNVAQWTISGNATIFQDTINKTEGTGSVRVSVNNTSVVSSLCGTQRPCGSLDKTVSMSLNGVKNVHLWAYTQDAKNISHVNFYFFVGSNFFNFGNNADINVQQGWNHFVISRDQFVPNTGSINWDTSTITDIRIVTYAAKNTNTNISWDAYAENLVSKPKAMINFDDARQSVYTKAKPVLDANGQRATVYDITAQIDDSEGTGYYMNLAQLNPLYTEGWDIGSHTRSHVDLTNQSTTNLYAQLNDSYNTLIANGFTRSAGFIAYPFGAYNQTVINAVQNTYSTGRTTVTNITQSNIDVNLNYVNYTIGAYGIFNTTTRQNMTYIINSSVNRSGLTVYLFHNITNNQAEATDNTDVEISNFTFFSNYLASKSANIDVITMYDYVNVNIPNNTPIIGKTVNVNSSGLTTMAVNNYLNDVTVNMSVVPSSDDVNVTVTTWNIGGTKTFIESSNNHSVITTNIIGDLPANFPVDIKTNGITSLKTNTNSSGYITFVYTGGFSDVQFQISPSQSLESIRVQTGIDIWLITLIAFFVILIIIIVFVINNIPDLDGSAAIIVFIVVVIVTLFIYSIMLSFVANTNV